MEKRERNLTWAAHHQSGPVSHSPLRAAQARALLALLAPLTRGTHLTVSRSRSRSASHGMRGPTDQLLNRAPPLSLPLHHFHGGPTCHLARL